MDDRPGDQVREEGDEQRDSAAGRGPGRAAIAVDEKGDLLNVKNEMPSGSAKVPSRAGQPVRPATRE